MARILPLFALAVALWQNMAMAAPAPVDLIIHGGTIYTLDETQPTVEAVAVQDGRIAALGRYETLKARIGRRTQRLDLEGQTMTPGFIESHAHLLAMGRARMVLDLSGAKNYRQLVEQVAEAVKTNPPGEWILGRGWHQSKWHPPPQPMVRGFQTHVALSRASPHNPVFLTHASGHAALANAQAMQKAGITPQTEYADQGEIIKDANGQPTGIFTERAQQLIAGRIPPSTPQRNRKALMLAIEEALANGITTFRDAGSDREAIALYREFLYHHQLKLRLWVMLDGSDQNLLEEWFQRGPEIGGGDHFLTIRAIKLFADGALGSRGAWLLESYSDRPGHFGHATIAMETVYRTARQSLQHGFQLCVHAIGDRANREVLNQIERALRDARQASGDHRFRIEHAQHLHPQDIPRFAQLNVIASMQGIHLSSDRPWAIQRLGKRRIEEGAYVWQRLLQSGAIIVNGTDAPVEPINPIASFFASVSRKTLAGTPPHGYEAWQKMTRMQALRSYTLDAAYGGFEEDLKGSIEVGKLADFTVFSQDILTVPEDRLLDTRITHTIINGRIVYRSTASLRP